LFHNQSIDLQPGYSNLSKPLLFLLNARDENCDRKFAWCDSRNELVGPEYPWGEFDPNDFLGNEVCLYFWLFPNRSNPIITDESCAGIKFFICEVKNLNFHGSF
jgi:hypothetical protein